MSNPIPGDDAEQQAKMAFEKWHNRRKAQGLPGLADRDGFIAGYCARIAADAPAETVKAAPVDVEFKRLADTILQATTNVARNEALRGIATLIDRLATPSPSAEVARDAAREFTEGVVYACARLIELFDQPTMAENILTESGVDPALGCEYDITFIRKIERFAAMKLQAPAKEGV